MHLSPDLTTETVEALLRDLGTTEMLLRGAVGPAGLWSNMPRPILNPDESYGWHAAEPRRPLPTCEAITRFDALYPLIRAGIRDDRHARVVHMRKLTYWCGHPREGCPVLSWTAIAAQLRCNRETAPVWWEIGVDQLGAYLRRRRLCSA